ncbi:hypothetical protein XELAEV_18007263mg [Xenopus laevis]|uniref:Ig-like domain-containing protein n=1 Tax=Xenopus laevis TaxID=8355 RepID=A0A974E207_XENLA|nr:hypothetical protein XELAEV_18007263mg [Xenopus laevis]
MEHCCITVITLGERIKHNIDVTYFLQNPFISVENGEKVTFNCTYETTDNNPYLHWYIQRPGVRLHFILLRHLFSKEEDEPGGKYSSKVNKESKSIDLRISGVSVSDSGLYYCAVSATVSLSAASSVQEALVLSMVLTNNIVLGNTVVSEETRVSSKSGGIVTLTCKYSVLSSSPTLFWYRQYPNQMQYILSRGAKGYASMKHDGEFQPGKFQSMTSDTSTNLTIFSLSVSDSALYLCALNDAAQCGTTTELQCKIFSCSVTTRRW